jgi:hypothetical protein
VPDSEQPQSSIVLYQTEDGQTRIQCRFENETIWLTQALIADLFQITVPTVNEHLKGIFAEGELAAAATIRKFRIVRSEGARQVARDIEHYSLSAILAVGYRVRSHRGTQFRQWATARLSEYLVKGFAMDDERLKNPPGKGQKDYFDELLERIRDIRSSERRFYQKVLDIYATSVDYTPNTELSQQFFATVQNKMHWATHGHTAAEVIHQRADAKQPLMGLKSTRPGKTIRREDVAVAKNYVGEEELQTLNPNPAPPDTSEADLAWVNVFRVLQPLQTFEQKLKLTGAVDRLPRTYIYCTKSRPGDVFRQFRDRASSEKGWKCIDIDASHSPHVTAPDALVQILDELAAASA